MKPIIPVKGKGGETITHVPADTARDTDVIFIGSGEARRTFKLQGGIPHDMFYGETSPKYLQSPDTAKRGDSIMCPDLPREAMPDSESVEADAFQVTLKPGQVLLVNFHETDGDFVIGFDYKGDKRVFIHAGMEGNVCGDYGVIYCEKFGVEAQDNVVDAKLKAHIKVRLLAMAIDGKRNMVHGVAVSRFEEGWRIEQGARRTYGDADDAANNVFALAYPNEEEKP